MVNISDISKEANEKSSKEVSILKKIQQEDELRAAIQNNDEKLVEKLLKNSDCIICDDSGLQILLRIAISVSNKRIIDMLVCDRKFLLEKELMKAIENNDEKMVKDLIKYGANVNYKNDKLQTPLHIAMSISNGEIIEELIKNNADVKARDLMGRTPLFYTKITGYAYDEEKLEDDKYVPTKEDIDNMKLLIIHGANIDEMDALGFSILHWGVAMANINSDYVFKVLIEELGAEVDIKAEDGYTPLYLAIMQKDVRMMKILLEYGANRNLNDNYGYSEVLENKECETIDITGGLEKNIKSQLDSIFKLGKCEIDKKRKSLLSDNVSKDIEKLNQKLVALEEKAVKWNEMYNTIYLFVNDRNLMGNSTETYRNIIKHLNYIKNCYLKKDFNGNDFEGRVDWSMSINFLHNNLESKNIHYIVKIMGKELKELTKMNETKCELQNLNKILESKNLPLQRVTM